MSDASIIGAGMLALQSGRAAPRLGHADGAAETAKVAQNFEAFFLGQMLQPMFSGMSADGPFGGGHAEQIWRSLMVDEMGKAMARSGGIGLADSIQAEMLRMQEVQQ